MRWEKDPKAGKLAWPLEGVLVAILFLGQAIFEAQHVFAAAAVFFSCLLSAANQLPSRTYTYMDGCGGYQERDHHFLYVRKSIHLLRDQNGKTEDSRFEALQLKKACLLMD